MFSPPKLSQEVSHTKFDDNMLQEQSRSSMFFYTIENDFKLSKIDKKYRSQVILNFFYVTFIFAVGFHFRLSYLFFLSSARPSACTGCVCGWGGVVMMLPRPWGGGATGGRRRGFTTFHGHQIRHNLMMIDIEVKAQQQYAKRTNKIWRNPATVRNWLPFHRMLVELATHPVCEQISLAFDHSSPNSKATISDKYFFVETDPRQKRARHLQSPTLFLACDNLDLALLFPFTSMCSFSLASSVGVFPNLSGLMVAPCSTSQRTTYMWPLEAAKWRGVAWSLS